MINLKLLFKILSLVYLLIFFNINAWAETTNSAIMQGLDKVTARVYTIDISIGEVANFGALKIKLHHCDIAPPEDTPESTAFIEVVEERRGEEAITLFNGWMFASSPALSSIEHPVYDVWLLKCVNGE